MGTNSEKNIFYTKRIIFVQNNQDTLTFHIQSFVFKWHKAIHLRIKGIRYNVQNIWMSIKITDVCLSISLSITAWKVKTSKKTNLMFKLYYQQNPCRYYHHQITLLWFLNISWRTSKLLLPFSNFCSLSTYFLLIFCLTWHLQIPSVFLANF